MQKLCCVCTRQHPLPVWSHNLSLTNLLISPSILNHFRWELYQEVIHEDPSCYTCPTKSLPCKLLPMGLKMGLPRALPIHKIIINWIPICPKVPETIMILLSLASETRMGRARRPQVVSAFSKPFRSALLLSLQTPIVNSTAMLIHVSSGRMHTSS